MSLEKFSFSEAAMGAGNPINPKWEAFGNSFAMMQLGKDWRVTCISNEFGNVGTKRHVIANPATKNILVCFSAKLYSGCLSVSAANGDEFKAVNLPHGSHGRVSMAPSGLILFRESKINGWLSDTQDGQPAQQFLHPNGSLWCKRHYASDAMHDPDKFTPHELYYDQSGAFLRGTWANSSSLSETEYAALLVASKQEKLKTILETEPENVALQRTAPSHIQKQEDKLCR